MPAMCRRSLLPSFVVFSNLILTHIVPNHATPSTTDDSSWLLEDTTETPTTTTTDDDSNNLLNYTFKQNCSAISSFVAIVSPTSLRDTLLSSQALFTPHSYHLASTELILLESEDNNACFDSFSNTTFFDEIELVTDVANKAVLIWHGSDYINNLDDPNNTNSCSDESKIYLLEKYGALAVLIANNEDYNLVESVEIDYEFEDAYNYSPNIPVRMISQYDGWIIENYLNSQSNIDKNEINSNDTLRIEISCLNNDYPSIICIVDDSGDVWFIDGDFEQQGSDILTYNSHPVFTKDLYFGLVSELYMFLQDSSDSDLEYATEDDSEGVVKGWHWVISFVLGSTDSSDVVGYCNDTSVDPAECKVWITWESSSGGSYTVNDDIEVSDEICEVAESYICVESSKYNIAGVGGTYKLLTDSEPWWFRELTEEDMTPSTLFLYTAAAPIYYFVIEESVDYDPIAQCGFVDLSIDDDTKFSPEKCSPWYVVADSTTDTSILYRDNTFSITHTQCETTTTTSDDNSTDDGTHLCLGGLTLNHGLVEGEYTLHPNLTTGSGRSVWYSTHLDENSDEYDAYIYYLGDIYSSYTWWVIGRNAPDSNSLSLYAYCAAMVDHPSDCQGCWNFYFNGNYDPDCEFYVDRGECEATTAYTTVSNEDLPTYLCLDFDISGNNDAFYSGTYMISTELTNNTEDMYAGGKLYWSQIINARGTEQSSSYYLVYDVTFQFWVFGDSLDGWSDAYYKCSDYDGNNPYYCTSWSDISTNSEIDLIIKQTNCNITTSPTRAPTDKPVSFPPTTALPTTEIIIPQSTAIGGSGEKSSNGGNGSEESASETALLVVAIILLSCCIVFLLVYVGIKCYKNKKYPGRAGFGAEMPNDDEMEMHRRASGMVLVANDGAAGAAGGDGAGGGIDGFNETIDGTMGGAGTGEQDESNSNSEDNGENNENGNDSVNDENSVESDDIVKPEAVGTTKGQDEENEHNGNENNDEVDGNYEDNWTSFD